MLCARIVSETLLAAQVPNDTLELRVPVWITDLQFFPNDPHRIATATSFGQVGRSCVAVLAELFLRAQVRLYDIRAGETSVASVLAAAGVNSESKQQQQSQGKLPGSKKGRRLMKKLQEKEGCVIKRASSDIQTSEHALGCLAISPDSR